ncbi:MAG: hypothetical protein ETSY2_18305 [Candidatus Entotheonella gemina]|uniref:Uncharacterized protein n=1 Tax=Candidatus Entotheonella gemina TaxID=1429439 RepID=W4M8K3_9BACT|nr:MAG: hypothetical protein ETSY2_18305 [Candidatus Entotheonella gemina]
MSITVEAIYAAGILKPLSPLTDLPENTKVRITVETVADTEPRRSVIDEQRRSRLHIDSQVARDIGESHEYDLFES